MVPELELAALWNNEGDDIRIHIEPPIYADPGSVALYLTADTTNRYDIAKPAGVDDLTLCWSFYGNTIAETVDIALGFARELAALKPPDDD